MRNAQQIVCILALGAGLAMGSVTTASAAATLDFTQGGWGNTQNNSQTQTLNGFRVELVGDPNNLTDLQAYDGAANACDAVGLACITDGVGLAWPNVLLDDEINILQGETLTINFLDGPVTINGSVYVLDLVFDPINNSNLRENASVKFFDGLNGGGSQIGGGTFGGVDDETGLVGFVAGNIAGVQSIELTAAGGDFSDLALAGITGVVPLPAAILMFGSAMMGLGALRARRRMQAKET